MPQAVAAVATWYAGLSATAAFFVNIAISATLSVISSKLFGPKFDSVQQGLRSLQATTRSALEYRKIVYGEAMLSGPVIYEGLSGAENEYLWYRIALTGHQVDSLISIWIDNTEIVAADIDWTAGTGASDGTGTGDVSTASLIGSNSTEAVAAWYYLGDPDQPVPGALNTAFSDINSAHRCRGHANIVVRLLLDEDTEEVWEAGVPRDFKAVLRGHALYDPRLDSTNGGSGSHRYTDETTWEWSDNPALCVAHYLMQYMNVPAATGIDWTSVADAADDCDATVAIPTASTETRFTCNGVLSHGESHRDNLEALLSSFDGRLTHKSGVWTVRASVWEASSVSLTEDHFVSDLEVRGSAPTGERFNVVRGHFVDPARKYEPVEFEPVTDATYVTRDGSDEIEQDLSLPCTNSNYMAQRIGFRLLEQSDNQIVLRGTVNEIGANIAPQSVIDVTSESYSWTAKTFRVIRWEPSGPGRYDIEARVDVSAAYSDPAEGDYTVPGGGSTITVPGAVIAAPSGLTATAVPVGIRLDWTNPAAGTYDFIDIYESATSAWAGASLIGSVRANTYTVPKDPNTTCYYWIRARRASGQESLRNPNSDTSTVTATSGAGGCTVDTLDDVTLADTDSGTVEVGYRVGSDGDIYRKLGTGGSYTSIHTWKGSCANTEYECRLSRISGLANTSGDNQGQWYACSADRTWVWTQSVAGTRDSVCEIQIRRTSDNVVIGSATVTVDLEHL